MHAAGPRMQGTCKGPLASEGHACEGLRACKGNACKGPHLSFGRLDLLHGVGMKVGCSRHARHDGGGFGGGIDAALALAAASIATLAAAHVADAYRREDLIEGGVLCSLDLRRWRRDCARVLCSSTAIRGHQRPPEATRSLQRPSEANQRPSVEWRPPEAIRGLQRPIRGHQWSGAHQRPSEAIRGQSEANQRPSVEWRPPPLAARIAQFPPASPRVRIRSAERVRRTARWPG